MKILIITDAWFPQVNGVVRTLFKTRECLIAAGHDVEMITPEPFFSVPLPSYPEIRIAPFANSAVQKKIRDYEPDALHIATEGPLGLAARRYAVKINMPFTTAYHTRFPEYVKARTGIPLSVSYAFLRWFHKKSERVMVPTPAVITALKDWRIGNPVLWPRGVDLDLFSPGRASFPRKKNPVYLSIGRVAVEKNLEAFLSLDLEGEKWVVGDGPDLVSLKKKYPDVTFFGMKSMEELPDYYRSADVFVFPSKTDTFGLVMLEAMGCGLPVAAYPVDGPIDVLGNTKSAVMDNDLKKACESALHISRKSARKYAENFSWQSATEIFASHLETRLKNSTAPRPKKSSECKIDYKVSAQS